MAKENYVNHPIDTSKEAVYEGAWDGDKAKQDLIKEEKDRVPFEEYNSYERTYNEVREVVKIAERMLEYGLSVKETEAYINKEIGLMPTLVSCDYKELAELIIEVDDYGVTVKDDNGCVYYFN